MNGGSWTTLLLLSHSNPNSESHSFSTQPMPTKHNDRVSQHRPLSQCNLHITFPHHLSTTLSPRTTVLAPPFPLSTSHPTRHGGYHILKKKKSTSLSRTVLALILFLILSVSITGATNTERTAAAAWGWPLMTAVVSRCTSRLVPVFNDPAQLPPPFVLLSFCLKWNESNKYKYNIFIKSTTTALYYYPFHYHHQFGENLSFKLSAKRTPLHESSYNLPYSSLPPPPLHIQLVTTHFSTKHIPLSTSTSTSTGIFLLFSPTQETPGGTTGWFT